MPKRDLTKNLVKEHKLIERMIDVLEQSVNRLEKGEKVELAIFEQATNFIRNFADKFHHAKEEEILFKEMTKKGMPEKDSPVEAMLIEHEQGRDFVKGVIKATKEMKKEDKKAVAKIIRNARGYMELLREHIDKENNILYPLAERMFTEKEKDKQLSQFKKAEFRKGGKAKVRKYSSLVKSLENNKIAMGG